MPTVRTQHSSSATETCSLEEAATHLAISVETFCRLQKIGILPRSNISAKALDGILAELLKNGLPCPIPTRKSQWHGFPFVHAVWKQIDGGFRLHARWRHFPDAKPIRHPFGTPLWIKEWFAYERHHYAVQKHPVPTPNNTAAHPDNRCPSPAQRNRQSAPAASPNQPAAAAANRQRDDRQPSPILAPDTQQSVTWNPSPKSTRQPPRSPAELASKMQRRRARVTQAEIARIIRAAKQAGASEIELRLSDSGSAVIRLQPDGLLESDEDIVL